MSSMAGKIALVTGGTQGLGAAVARTFAARGAAGIVISGRSREKGESQARAIESETGTRVVFVPSDLGSVEDCRRLVAETDAAFGRIDALVNAAGMTDRGTILDTSPELFDRMFAVNVKGPFFLMQETIRLMIRDGIHGTIVNIGSMSAKAGQPFLAAYSSSKGALVTLTENTAYAVLRNRIRVNALNIGWMASDGEDQIQKRHHGAPDDWLEAAASRQPFGRLIDPAEIARAVAFLCSEESGLMTGSTINYDQSVWGAYDGAPHPVDAL